MAWPSGWLTLSGAPVASPSSETCPLCLWICCFSLEKGGGDLQELFLPLALRRVDF